MIDDVAACVSSRIGNHTSRVLGNKALDLVQTTCLLSQVVEFEALAARLHLCLLNYVSYISSVSFRLL